MIIKIIKIQFFILFFLIFSGGILINVYESIHHDKAKEMFAFVGKEYAEEADIDNFIKVEMDNVFKEYLYNTFTPRGPSINITLFFKDHLELSGLENSCQSIDYLKLLRDDIPADVYNDSHLCCMPPLTTDMIPIVIDEKEDRVLAMCGLAGDAHVISLSTQNFNKLLNPFGALQEGQPLDVRELLKDKT